MDLGGDEVAIIMMDDGTLAYSSIVENNEETVYEQQESIIYIKNEQASQKEPNFKYQVHELEENVQVSKPSSPSHNETCFICKKKIRKLLDPWSDIVDCRTAFSGTEMTDFLVTFVAGSNLSDQVTFMV